MPQRWLFAELGSSRAPAWFTVGVYALRLCGGGVNLIAVSSSNNNQLRTGADKGNPTV